MTGLNRQPHCHRHATTDLGATDVTRSPRLKVRAGPAGIHVFDRSTGANLLIDEARVPCRHWSNAPRNVSIALTNACDLHCPYCYAPKDPAVLDIDILYRWLDELDSHGCLGIGFGGGEPTLCRQLPALCRFIANSTHMAATFTTHGHRLDDKLAADLHGNVHFIRVSMDGVGSTYETLRGKPFEALLIRLDIVRHLCPFGINYVVNSQTVGDLDRAIELAAQRGAAEFLLLPEQPAARRPGIDAVTREHLQQWVARYAGPVRLAVSAGGADGLPACDPLQPEMGLRAYAHIDAHGVLKESSYDKSGIEIGQGGILEAIARFRLMKGAPH